MIPPNDSGPVHGGRQQQVPRYRRTHLSTVASLAIAMLIRPAHAFSPSGPTSGLSAPLHPPTTTTSAVPGNAVLVPEAHPPRSRVRTDGLVGFAQGDDLDGPHDAALTRRGFFRSAASTAAAAALCAVPEAAEAAGDGGRTDALGGSEAIADATAAAAADSVDFEAILRKSAKRALGGGKAGASAAVVQVLSLMWLRTAMNYQYRYGGDLGSSLRTLTEEGGIPRLYQGLPFALVQGPLTRFGDTAANTGVLALLEALPETAGLPLPLRTAVGSVVAGLWRIFLMPVDTSKTAMQVEGAEGLERLKERVIDEGPWPLYQGALASAAATAAGHFPWFLTYNFLNDALPAVSKEELLLFLVRSAFLGLSASCVSDCVSNSLRVIKTTKQTAALGTDSASTITYREALQLVLDKDGLPGLFGRGLKTRLLTNALQGAVFSVLWKYFQTV